MESIRNTGSKLKWNGHCQTTGMIELQKPIGILGGTFDPVHNGHLYIASCVLKDTPVEEVKFIPCYQPVHRTNPHATCADRVMMLKLALEDLRDCSLDEQEIQRESSFMIDTLISLRNDYSSTPLCLILGIDAYLNITSWKKWQQLLDYAHFLVINRPNFTFKHHPDPWLQIKETTHLEFITHHLSGGILFLSVTPNPISATRIRQKIQHHEDISSLVPPKVAQYIGQHSLYI